MLFAIDHADVIQKENDPAINSPAGIAPANPTVNTSVPLTRRTSIAGRLLGEVVYELNAQQACGGDQYLVGVQFVDPYFYITSGSVTLGPQVYVVDTGGTLIWQMNQPGHSTGWGWRDIAWDGTYVGPDRIDTLYSSVNNNVDKWGVNLTTGTLNYYGGFAGPTNPNRAMAWDGDDGWFFTSNWTPQTKFSKTNPNIQTVAAVTNVYGAAYDTNIPMGGGWIWWHSQNNPGTGYSCRIDQMLPSNMSLPGVQFGFVPTLSATGMAGGLSFMEQWEDSCDVLMALVQGTPDEICAVFIRENSGTTFNHDVGCDAILQPPTSVMPNTVHAPEAHYRNYGTNNETFDVYFVIDSSGTIVYSETFNISLNAGSDTNITFANWTAGPNNAIVYDCFAYTVLGGDERPANDTTTIQVTVNSMFWEILDPPVLPARGSGHGAVTLHDGTYHVFSLGAGYNQVQIYDIATNTWSAGANNPTGAGQYGALGLVNGLVYRIGGWNGTSADTRVDIYDPVGNSWSTGTAAPSPQIDCACGVYNDTLLYTMGGGNWYSGIAPHNQVRFYDPANNAWTSATAFPGAGRGCASGGVIDSFIVVAFGFSAGPNQMRIDYILGVINAANPATITWGSVTPVPGMGADSLYRAPCGVDISNKELWVTNGQEWTVQINRTWSYSPYTDTWTEWLFPKPQATANVSPIVITETALGDLGVFVPGGYYGGGEIDDHEVFHTGLTGIAEKPYEHGKIEHFGFVSNMANPSTGHVPITYTTTKSGPVTLKVYDSSGRLIKTLVNRPKEMAGSKTVHWNGNDDSNRAVPNGIYFLKLEAENKVDTYKLVLVK